MKKFKTALIFAVLVSIFPFLLLLFNNYYLKYLESTLNIDGFVATQSHLGTFTSVSIFFTIFAAIFAWTGYFRNRPIPVLASSYLFALIVLASSYFPFFNLYLIPVCILGFANFFIMIFKNRVGKASEIEIIDSLIALPYAFILSVYPFILNALRSKWVKQTDKGLGDFFTISLSILFPYLIALTLVIVADYYAWKNYIKRDRKAVIISSTCLLLVIPVFLRYPLFLMNTLSFGVLGIANFYWFAFLRKASLDASDKKVNVESDEIS